MAQDMMTTAARTDLAHKNGGEAMRPAWLYRPNTDIYETPEHVVLVMDMPGVGPDDVDITLERNVLSIRGRSRFERAEGYRQLYAEYGEGDYERSFVVSDEIDRDRLEATCANGVLTLKLPKAEAAKPKRVAVTAA